MEPSSTQALTPRFDERLWPGPVGWLIALGLGAMFGVAFVPVSPMVGAIALVLALAAALTMLAIAATRVRVADGHLHAGSAHIPLDLLHSAEALDAERTRAALGPELDARAYLCLRGWVKTSVRVQVSDPQDPTPYWIISTRRPEQLVAAIG